MSNLTRDVGLGYRYVKELSNTAFIICLKFYLQLTVLDSERYDNQKIILKLNNGLKKW